jgi:hypothetical protein
MLATSSVRSNFRSRKAHGSHSPSSVRSEAHFEEHARSVVLPRRTLKSPKEILNRTLQA